MKLCHPLQDEIYVSLNYIASNLLNLYAVFNPVYIIILGGFVDCLEMLICHGADLDVPDIKAQTPLMMAVKNQHINCVSALLLAGANPNGDARSLCSPVYIAAMNGYKAILEVIIN